MVQSTAFQAALDGDSAAGGGLATGGVVVMPTRSRRPSGFSSGSIRRGEIISHPSDRGLATNEAVVQGIMERGTLWWHG